jgi:hypothetical protein
MNTMLVGWLGIQILLYGMVIISFEQAQFRTVDKRELLYCSS